MKLIGRRNFVEGLGLTAGAGLLGPFARSVVAEAQGLPLKNNRFIVLADQHGLGHGESTAKTVERWVPKNPNLAFEGALPPSLEPLTPWASKILILDWLSNPFNPGQHENGWAQLSVRGERPKGRSGPLGPSVDIFAGETLSAGKPFVTMGVGTDSSAPCVDAKNNPVSSFRNALQAFTQTFGNFVPSASGNPTARLKLKQSILDDVVKGDLARMRARLAGPESTKLEQMESSLRALETRIGSLVSDASSSKCVAPNVPSALSAGAHGGPMPAGYLPTMVSLQATALICRLTNVVVGCYSPGRRSYSDIPEVGHGKDKHDTSHDLSDAVLVKIDRYNAGHLAAILTALSKVPEGNGTMLDSTLAMWTDVGRHHLPPEGPHNIPIILVGSMNGHFKTGRHVRFPKAERAVSDAYVSCLQALGIPVNTFGDPSVCKGALPGLT